MTFVSKQKKNAYRMIIGSIIAQNQYELEVITALKIQAIKDRKHIRDWIIDLVAEKLGVSKESEK